MIEAIAWPLEFCSPSFQGSASKDKTQEARYKQNEVKRTFDTHINQRKEKKYIEVRSRRKRIERVGQVRTPPGGSRSFHPRLILGMSQGDHQWRRSGGP